jgi:hypothetical protein
LRRIEAITLGLARVVEAYREARRALELERVLDNLRTRIAAELPRVTA